MKVYPRKELFEDSVITLKDVIPSWGGNLVWQGVLNLEHTQITELPNNLIVCGWLDLSGTPITELPNKLQVNGDLVLCDTKITELPDNLRVRYSIYIDKGKKFDYIPNHLKNKIVYR